MSRAFRIFISCVSAEFRTYREDLRKALTSSGREIKIQEEFQDGAGTLLEKLDRYIRKCQAVIHLVGSSTGEFAKPAEIRWLLNAYPDFTTVMPELVPWLDPASCPFSYSQWECFLALYHRIPCFIYRAGAASQREADWVVDPLDTAAQTSHVERLRALGQDRRITDFADSRDVALRFLSGFFSDGGQAPAQVSDSVVWPVISGLRETRLADRETEFAEFIRMLGPEPAHRVLGIHGPSDRGKSALLAEFFRFARRQTGIVAAYAEFKGTLPLSDFLHDLRRDMRDVRLPRFDRYRDTGPAEMLRQGFLLDLEECTTPVVLILDGIDESTDEAREWVSSRLLPLCDVHAGVRVVLAGKTLPDLHSNRRIAGWVRCFELPPIADPAAWCAYGRTVLSLGPGNPPDEHIHTLVAAAKGSPRVVSSLLTNLKAASGPA